MAAPVPPLKWKIVSTAVVNVTDLQVTVQITDSVGTSLKQFQFVVHGAKSSYEDVHGIVRDFVQNAITTAGLTLKQYLDSLATAAVLNPL